MRYRVADLINGPFGTLFDTPEAAEAERLRCIEDGINADVRAGEITPEEARANAEAFFSVVEVDSATEGGSSRSKFMGEWLEGGAPKDGGHDQRLAHHALARTR